MGRFHPRQLLLVVALIAALATTGCGAMDDLDALDDLDDIDDRDDTASAPILIPPSTQADEVPLVADRPLVPLATPPSEPVPPVEVAVSPPVAAPSAEPTDPPGAATMRSAAPVRLQIASIGVDSELMDLGLRADGTLEVPPTGFPAGWYTGSPTPGELGPAIIAGHVDWAGQPGVFFDLRDLASGDEIAITRQDTSQARFRVTRVERFRKDAFPTQAVYGDLDHAGLRLITCGGEFDRKARSYVDNIVVFAEFIGQEASG